MVAFGVDLNIRPLNVLPGAMQEAVDEAADKTAKRVAKRASELAAKDTGSMAESVYFSSPFEDSSDYVGAALSAQVLNPRVEILPEIPQARHGEAFVAAAAGHSIYVEHGTSKMPAQPFLRPAAKEAEGIFAEELIDAALERFADLAIGRG